ncbi:S8 family serine peptidase [Streptomyces poriferorum]|uniref:S8 family serine peptidase n=1 Tax=Streptomyces poriferorum TaxID=2798799 RepID=UPI00273EE39E|nr:S8 family serine peptidase [Streptomyces sp. Alt1]WLQ51728.1 S8 family serine peptidase [Streptomyces sp. Alt1]
MHSPSRGRRGRRLIAVATVIATGALIPAVGSGAAAVAQPAAPQGGSLPAAAKPVQVTLVTGDRVSVTTATDGRQSATITPAPGNPKNFQTVTDPDGDLHVYPASALSGLGAKTLDRRLFNVSQLIRDGQSDSRGDSLPVIVSYDDKPSRSTLGKRADRLPGSERGLVLDRVDMAALHVDKSEAASFWKAAAPRTADNGRAAAAGSAVARIWYDAPAKVSLDKSVPQIHAPEAWAAGFDGTGTKVAVLDTGIDLNHADVKDRVVGSKSFVGTATVQDGHGHGTHVASTIAGSGAASGGRLKGVAPGAELLVGKVLADSGSGANSGVIAGMEWAVEQGADIVSMSLGDDAGTADDPTSQALERLSATSDSLFVVAAGNTGPGASTVGSPGAAPSALTVGAVDRADALADFSSRGPVGENQAIKPDITAPGVDIVAARAAGTAMGTVVDADYTSASGTSMATPHVAGAAAILAQRHPDWPGARIKAELTSHTTPSADYTVQEQGNGRVDVAASLDAKVDLSSPVDFGMIWFQKDRPYDKQTRTLTVSNPTDTATTVKLSAHTSTGTLTEGALTFDKDAVTLAAGGSTEVTATLDPNLLAPATYSGQITATTDGGATATSALGFTKETESYGLTVGLHGRDGAAPDNGLIVVMGVDNDYYESFPVGRQSSLKLRVPQGSYALFGAIGTGDMGFRGGFSDAFDLFSLPDVKVSDEPVEVAVDATKATDFRIDVAGDKRPRVNSGYAHTLRRTAGGRSAGVSLEGDAFMTSGHLGAIPAGKPSSGKLVTSFYHRERAPLMTAEVTGRGGFTLIPRTYEQFARFDGDRRLTLVDVGSGSPEEIARADVKGKVALVHDDAHYIIEAAELLEKAGAAAILRAPVTDRPVYAVLGEGLTIPLAVLDHKDGTRLADRLAEAGKSPVRVTLHGDKESAFAYGGQWDFENTIPADLTVRARRADFAKVTNRFHSYGTEQGSYYQQQIWSGATSRLVVRVPEPLLRGHERDDYVYAKAGQVYRQGVGTFRFGPEMFGRTETYRPGRSVTEEWFAPGLHPAPVGHELSCNFCSTDAGLIPYPGRAGDSDPAHYSEGGPTDQGFAFYRDGVEVPASTPWIIKDKAVYRLDLDMTYEAAGGFADSTSHSEYTFPADAPQGMNEAECKDFVGMVASCEPMAVILPHYGMETDLLNRVKAGKTHTFTLDGYRASGWTGTKKLAGAKVSLSYDGGKTWKAADVRRLDSDSFRVSAEHPKLAKTNGHASVRAELWDAAGSRTVETIDWAYGLK